MAACRARDSPPQLGGAGVPSSSAGWVLPFRRFPFFLSGPGIFSLSGPGIAARILPDGVFLVTHVGLSRCSIDSRGSTAYQGRPNQRDQFGVM